MIKFFNRKTASHPHSAIFIPDFNLVKSLLIFYNLSKVAESVVPLRKRGCLVSSTIMLPKEGKTISCPDPGYIANCNRRLVRVRLLV